MDRQALRRDFELTRLDLETFTHEDHIWLAWQYLCEKSVPEAMVIVSEGLRALTALAGQSQAYHETLTCAWICLIAARRSKAAEPDCWESFKSANEDLFTDHRGALGRYYSPEFLKTSESRTLFLLPDRCDGGRDLVTCP